MADDIDMNIDTRSQTHPVSQSSRKEGAPTEGARWAPMPSRRDPQQGARRREEGSKTTNRLQYSEFVQQIGGKLDLGTAWSALAGKMWHRRTTEEVARGRFQAVTVQPRPIRWHWGSIPDERTPHAHQFLTQLAAPAPDSTVDGSAGP